MKRKKFTGCYTCGGEKEPERENQSKCRKCHAAYMVESRAKKVNVNVDKLIGLINQNNIDLLYFKEIICKKGFEITTSI